MDRDTLATEEEMSVDMVALKDFLVGARLNCWIEEGQTAEPSLPGATRHVFEYGGFHYEDEFMGSEQFQGREVILRQGTPVWGMSYNGLVFPEGMRIVSVTREETYAFLKDALRVLINEARTGAQQESEFRQEPWAYVDCPRKSHATGYEQLTRFAGTEQVTVHESLVYLCNYVGGCIV